MHAGKPRAPTLYLIILFKLGKGLLLLLVAFGVYSLVDNNVGQEFQALLRGLHLDPEQKFWSSLAAKIQKITPENLYWLATGTAFYSMFSLVEAVGLIFRVTWAAWMAIGEAMFFIPIEIYDLVSVFTIKVSIILLLNIAICWYLLRNRHRLFHHAHFRSKRALAHSLPADL